MKINKSILSIFLIMTSCIIANEFFKEIEINGISEYKEFYITEDIYENSKNNLSDIRIIDNNKKEIPYVIENETVQMQYNEKTIAQSTAVNTLTKANNMEFIMKFDSNSVLHDLIANRLEIIPSKNFYTEYILFGSHNGTDWKQIITGNIYKTPDKNNLTINFENKRYEYYKLVTPLDKGTIISNAILKLSNNSNSSIKSKSSNLLYKTEEKGKTTIIKIKSKFLPLKNIVLNIDDEFKRNYSVRDSNGNYNEGTIYKVGYKNNLIINLSNLSSSNEIILEIFNNDNTPLKIKDIKGIYTPDKIIFKSQKGNEYKITFGNDKLQKPTYDLASFVNMIEKKDLVSTGQLHKTEIKQIPKKQDFTVYYNIFIGIITLILVGFMAKKISNNK